MHMHCKYSQCGSVSFSMARKQKSYYALFFETDHREKQSNSSLPLPLRVYNRYREEFLYPLVIKHAKMRAHLSY
jgi:hypothetical protein